MVKNSTEYREVKTRYVTKKNKKMKNFNQTTNHQEENHFKKVTVNNVTSGTNSTKSQSIISPQDSSNQTPILSNENANKNQDATNENIRLQPTLTKSRIGANNGQTAYDLQVLFQMLWDKAQPLLTQHVRWSQLFTVYLSSICV